MNDLQAIFGNLRIVALGDCKMLEPTLLKFAIAPPVIGCNGTNWFACRRQGLSPVFHSNEDRTDGHLMELLTID